MRQLTLVWISLLLVASSAVAAAGQGGGRPDSRQTGAARGVRILSPKEGSTIRGGSAPGPVPCPVDGDVYGFNQAEIQRFGLTVEVSVITSAEFEQGIAEVHNDGTWRLPTVWLGGATHTIRAVLKDSNGNKISSHEVNNVKVVR
jgi:hypothetical protein